MKLAGVEIPLESLSKLEPDTILVAVSDEQGGIKLIKIDNPPFLEADAVLKVAGNTTNEETQPQSGCYVWNGVKWIWVDPCPN